MDGIMCMNITLLTEDKHYQYEMSRLNSEYLIINKFDIQTVPHFVIVVGILH